MNRINTITDIVVKSLISMSYKYSNKASVRDRNRKHDFGLMFVENGHATLNYDGKVIHLHEGDGVFIPINTRYLYSRHQAGKVFVLNFYAEENTAPTEFIQFHIDDVKRITPYLEALRKTFFSNVRNKRLVTLSLFYEILFNILQNANVLNPPVLNKAINFMQENLENPLLNSAEIAKASGYSEGHLRRFFKQVNSVTPMQYLNNLRIENAKNLLLNTGLSVKEISEQCGFNSPFYFSTIFKAKLGRSPSRYRDENNIFI